MDELRSYSVLDFVRSQEKSDLCRLLFCATVKFSSEAVIKFFTRYASQIFTNEVTGILLVYPNYIVHLLESEENKIFQMCKHFVSAQPKFLGISKCFPMEIDVEERFFRKWHSRKIEIDCESLKINENSNFTDNENFDKIKYLYCRSIESIYTLCNELRGSRAISRVNFSKMLDSLENAKNPLLPDQETFKCILESPWGDSLESLVDDYWHKICDNDDDNEIWPFPRYQFPIMPLGASIDS